MGGTTPRISIDLSDEEKQLKEAGARPENFNWYQQIQSDTPQADPKIEINLATGLEEALLLGLS